MMTTELIVFLDDEATEDQIRDIAAVITMFPAVIGVWRQQVPTSCDYPLTHAAPGMKQ